MSSFESSSQVPAQPDASSPVSGSSRFPWRRSIVKLLPAVLGLAILVLNHPLSVRFSPLWEKERVELKKAVAKDTLFRIAVPKLAVGTTWKTPLAVSAGLRSYDRVASNALRASPGPAFAITNRWLWLKLPDGENLSKYGGRIKRCILGKHRLDSAGIRRINILGIVLLVLPMFMFGRIAQRTTGNLPPMKPALRHAPCLDAYVENSLRWFVAVGGSILLVGYLLSAFHLMDRVGVWLAGVLLCIALWVWVWRKQKLHVGRVEPSEGVEPGILRTCLAELKAAPWACVPALLLAGVLLVAQIAQLLVIAMLPPGNHDSITYILPRLAYYVQQGSVAYYDSNYVALTVHFKNASVLQAFTFLLTGRSENAVSLVALFCSWAAILSAFGIARLLFGRIIPALAAAAVAGLSTNVMMIAVTPQIDLPVTAFFTVALYFLVRSSDTRGAIQPIAWSMMSLAIACGAKATALLLLPAFACVALACWLRHGSWLRKPSLRPSLVLAAVAVASIAAFMVPAGYYDNWKRYGSIMGPKAWRDSVVLPAMPPKAKAREVLRNAARYVVHFVGLDGMPYSTTVLNLQSDARSPLIGLTELLGLDLFETGTARQPFASTLFWAPNEDLSYPGVAFLLLTVTGGVAAMFWRFTRGICIALGLAAALYLLAQSASSRYDPWRGRSFTSLVMLAAPLSAAMFCQTRGPGHTHLNLLRNGILVAGCLIGAFTGVNSAFFRYMSPFHPVPGTLALEGGIFSKASRLELVCRGQPAFLERARIFESHVPEGASVLLLGKIDPNYAYLYWGARCQRRVFYSPHVGTAQFTVFSSSEVQPQSGDILLGPSRLDMSLPYSLYLRRH